jgi:hypothetical protein
MARKTTTKRTSTKKTARKAAKRVLIATGTDKRFVRRSVAGQFKESDDVGKSLTADRRKKAKTKSTAGQGDKGGPLASRYGIHRTAGSSGAERWRPQTGE